MNDDSKVDDIKSREIRRSNVWRRKTAEMRPAKDVYLWCTQAD